MSSAEFHKHGPGEEGQEYQHPPPPVAPSAGVVTATNAPVVGSGPTTLVCPSCHATVQTRVQYETSTRTHLMALLLCAIGCWCCAVIPYFKDSCKNAAHHCPDCGAYLGVYNN
ncbi:lipopolysaccharide-induced tumor necrosis factor-alpha factor homolog [Bacillus rossius redtenbacheri]|uniref:lipopolysaccharide-induced tumor necrosis factor-alpha factor homolog n=1 Tax=Bacillus rossius redtenbacheri TaxID=93214 RepID=UPI002FDEB855